jgi:hypothetical protein
MTGKNPVMIYGPKDDGTSESLVPIRHPPNSAGAAVVAPFADMPKSTRMTWLPFAIQDRLVHIYDYDTPSPNAVAAWPAP